MVCRHQRLSKCPNFGRFRSRFGRIRAKCGLCRMTQSRLDRPRPVGLGQFRQNPGNCLSLPGHLRSKLAELGPKWRTSGLRWSMTVLFRPIPDRSWPNWGQIWSKSCRILTNSGQVRSIPGQAWSILRHVGRLRANLGRIHIWLILGRVSPTLAKIQPNSSSAHSTRIRPTIGSNWANINQDSNELQLAQPPFWNAKRAT